ncbi:LolA-like protein [Actinomadura napierensis]|uniref:Lipoprotein n=1 Tax=Actinomadura napierensis TaxID=267854 RepID=A0ABP5KU88_9ACTN
MIRRFATGTAAAAGLALALTGCLGDAGNKAGEAGENIRLTAAQVLGKTAQKTGQIDSFQADMSMTATGSSSGSMNMAGTMQYRTKPDLAFSMNFTNMTVGGQSMAGMQEVLVGRTIYMKIPQLTQLGGGASAKPWVKMSLDEVGAKSGMNVDELLQQSEQMDPVKNTKMLTASKDAREVGKETVNGVQTTHYTGTYRMSDAVAKLPADQRQAFEKNLAKSGMNGDMHFDLWVDGQQLPRKMTMKTGQTAAGVMTITTAYRDFGKPVQVSAPPASQVTDFNTLMKGLGTGAGPGA